MNTEQSDFQGNREHLEVLLSALNKNDIPIWNKWKQGQASGSIDLKGIDLSYSKNLREIDFSQTDLSSAAFCNSSLEDITFHQANCSWVDFNDSIIKKVDFSKATLYEMSLIMANLLGVDFREANLRGTIMMETKLTDTILTGAILNNNHLVRCKIQNLDCEYLFVGDDDLMRIPLEGNFSQDDLKNLFTDQRFISKEELDFL